MSAKCENALGTKRSLTSRAVEYAIFTKIKAAVETFWVAYLLIYETLSALKGGYNGYMLCTQDKKQDGRQTTSFEG